MDLKKTLNEIAAGIFRDLRNIFQAAADIHKNNRVLADLFIVAVGMAAVVALTVAFLARNRWDGRLYKVEIPEGSSASSIAQKLYLENIIQSRFSFKAYISLFGFEKKLKAGSYYLGPKMSNAQIVSILSKGRADAGEVRVTIPEGTSIYKMSKILGSSGVKVKDGDFFALAQSGLTNALRLKYPFLSQIPNRSLEGYLFPDTYFLPYSVSVNQLTDIMLDRFSEVAIPVIAGSRSGKYDLHQIITLASIIEKESSRDEERPIISSVFHNRLDRGIALRADPTVKYILENPTKRVMFADLKTDSPYNTYLYKGLPPGPICSPGLASIKAAIEPAKTDYLYFVSNGDGTHTFSRTWEEHKEAAERFRKK